METRGVVPNPVWKGGRKFSAKLEPPTPAVVRAPHSLDRQCNFKDLLLLRFNELGEKGAHCYAN